MWRTDRGDPFVGRLVALPRMPGPPPPARSFAGEAAGEDGRSVHDADGAPRAAPRTGFGPSHRLIHAAPASGQDASRTVIRRHRVTRTEQLRVVRTTFLDRDGAARMKSAAARNPRRIRRFAGEDLWAFAVTRVSPRHHGEQGLRVWVLRVLDDLRGRADLDDPPEVHDCDSIRVARSRRKVVR